MTVGAALVLPGQPLTDTKRARDDAHSSGIEGRLTVHASDARARTGKCSVLGRQQPAGPCRLQAFVSRGRMDDAAQGQACQ